MRRSIWSTFVCSGLTFALSGWLHAEPALLTFDAAGKLLAQTAVIVRPNGYAYTNREAFYGAARAVVLDDERRISPVLWVTGDDPDAGVLQIWVGLQIPKGPDDSSGLTQVLHSPGHESKADHLREAGAFGFISTLDCQPAHGAVNGPLYDEHGLFAGWHVSREVDGKRFSFAVPLERIHGIDETIHSPVEEWSKAHTQAKEVEYQRAIGYVWLEEFDGALFYLRKAVELDPGNARAWLHLGFAEGKAGHGKRRLECYRKALELDETLPEAHYLLGFCLLLAGDQDGARTQVSALKKLNSEYGLRLEKYMGTVHIDSLDGTHPTHRPPKRVKPKRDDAIV